MLIVFGLLKHHVSMVTRDTLMNDKSLPTKPSNNSDISEFLRKVAATPSVKAAHQRGRLIFAMDATASRAPTWDRACHIQANMFKETAALGGLDIQLVYYRGHHEFSASEFHSNTDDLSRSMASVACMGGMTQIEKVLQQALHETTQRKVHALVFVGDCMEEDAETLFVLAGKLGVVGLPVFIFHEGDDALAAQTFEHIAKLSHGAYCHFDSNSAQQLHDLLSAVAIYAAGGRRALEQFAQQKNLVRQVILQLPKQS